MPIDAGSLHFLVGPAIAFVMLGLLALFMRWAFGSGYGRQPAPPAARGGRPAHPASPRSPAASPRWRCARCCPTPASARRSASRPRTAPTSWSSPRTPTAPGPLAATFPAN